jgi:hypothetical protein
MNEKYYQDFSEPLNYSYLFFGGGSFISLVGSLIYNIPLLSVLATVALWGSFYFLPNFNEIRSRVKYGKKTDEVKNRLVISGVGIGFVAILAYCFFVLDYRLYYKNEKLILILYTIIILFMLVNAVMKLLEKIKELKYKSKLKKKVVISILLIVIQFILFSYPISDYIKVKNKYSLPSIKVASGVRVREMDISEAKKSPIVDNINELPSYISDAISNKPSKDLAFLESLRVELEEQRKKYFEVVFDYKLKENDKGKNEAYASSLKVFTDNPIVVLTLKDNDNNFNKLSEYRYKIEIELSEEEYKTARDYIADISNVKR